ncbi:hypothetical protein [Ferrimonas balearica]|uniref:hypothetical protein n=1 Tax=Ferrimonas balearica TaxID=44012 RepID=UPI001C979880|nr:hypothetical protein [Ferrimonas balearica]MBY6224336.1 hypothetical protein [Ferrimonas balearica]
MNLKVSCASFALLLGLSACSERDLLYYQSNLDEAKMKVEECKETILDSISSKDKESLKSAFEDPECKAAATAYDDYRKQRAKAEREKREEEERLVYERDFSKYISEFKAMSFSDFYMIAKGCNTFSENYKRSAKCKAFDEVEESKVEENVNALIEKYPGESLIEFRKGKCKGTGYDKGECFISREAVKQQRNSMVQNYLDNREALKSTFNACQKEYSRLRKSKKFAEANRHEESFECDMVLEAAKQLKVFSFSKPIE